MFSAIFLKENNFLDFMFVSLKDKALQKGVFSWRKKLAIFFF